MATSKPATRLPAAYIDLTINEHDHVQPRVSQGTSRAAYQPKSPRINSSSNGSINNSRTFSNAPGLALNGWHSRKQPAARTSSDAAGQPGPPIANGVVERLEKKGPSFSPLVNHVSHGVRKSTGDASAEVATQVSSKNVSKNIPPSNVKHPSTPTYSLSIDGSDDSRPAHHPKATSVDQSTPIVVPVDDIPLADHDASHASSSSFSGYAGGALTSSQKQHIPDNTSQSIAKDVHGRGQPVLNKSDSDGNVLPTVEMPNAGPRMPSGLDGRQSSTNADVDRGLRTPGPVEIASAAFGRAFNAVSNQRAQDLGSGELTANQPRINGYHKAGSQSTGRSSVQPAPADASVVRRFVPYTPRPTLPHAASIEFVQTAANGNTKESSHQTGPPLTTESAGNGPLKRTADGQFKTHARPADVPADSRRFMPHKWDSALPLEVKQLLEAMRDRALPNGRPNRYALSLWAKRQNSDAPQFDHDGQLSKTSILWKYPHWQLGLTHEGWQYLVGQQNIPVTLSAGPTQVRQPSYPLGPSAESPVPGNREMAVHTDPVPASLNQGLAGISMAKPALQVELALATDQLSSSVIHERHNSAPHVSPTNKSVAPAYESPVGGLHVSSVDAQTDMLRKAVDDIRSQRDLKGAPWTPEEDNLLMHLKETLGLPWHKIGTYFLYRFSNWQGCQVRYSTKLKRRNKKSATRDSPTTTTNVDTEDTIGSSGIAVTQSYNELPRKSSRLEKSDASSRNYRPLDYFRKQFGRDLERENSTQLVDDDTAEERQASRVIYNETNGSSFHKHIHARSLQHECTTYFSSQDRTQSTMRDALAYERYRAAQSGGLLKVPRPPKETRQRPLLSAVARRSRAQKRQSICIDRPYLGSSERQCLKQMMTQDIWHHGDIYQWQDAPLHVDFTSEEIEKLESFIDEVFDQPLYMSMYINAGASPRRRLRLMMQELVKSQDSLTASSLIRKVARHVVNNGGLLNRSRDSIEGFLKDTALPEDPQAQATHESSSINKIATLQCRTKDISFHTGLRHRELGGHHQAARHWRGPTVQKGICDTLGPLLSFTGTSNDVTSVAWAPHRSMSPNDAMVQGASDISMFAVGSAAHTDDHSMQYNRPNNLLLGDTALRTLRELPHHATKRNITASGANSTREMHSSQDPILFQSVSAVAFSANGDALFSTGYDGVARIFDIRNGIHCAYQKSSFNHKARIDVLAVDSEHRFATGAARSNGGVRVFKGDLDAEDPNDLRLATYSSRRAQENPDLRIFPTSLKWGPSRWSQSRYLLCGFSSELSEFGAGEVCAWDLERPENPSIMARGSRNIFDVAWSPSTFGRFAVARTPVPQSVNRGTQSVVHLFDSRRVDGSMQIEGQRTIELKCPALDINDVVFNPGDDCILSVGCTDNSTYIWDLRMADRILHRFAHGKALMELDDNLDAEEVDTGVRFLSWDATRRDLLSGSSDGVVARWDPYRASEDAHINDVTQLSSGVMSGAFSPDFSALLLGEVNGSVNVLGVGRDAEEDAYESFKLRQADENEMNDVYGALGIYRPNVSDESGMTAAKDLLESDAMTLRPFGDLPIRQAVQGPAYSGPYDNSMDADQLRQKSLQRQASMRPSASPCKLVHDIPRLTEEEKGDNAASQDRRPEKYRFLPSADKKAHCEEHIRCPRCNGQSSSIAWSSSSIESDLLGCSDCGKTWRIDLLGYTPFNVHSGEPQPAMHDEETPQATEQASGNSREDDDLQALDDYVHSFWQDRSASPL